MKLQADALARINLAGKFGGKIWREFGGVRNHGFTASAACEQRAKCCRARGTFKPPTNGRQRAHMDHREVFNMIFFKVRNCAMVKEIGP